MFLIILFWVPNNFYSTVYSLFTSRHCTVLSSVTHCRTILQVSGVLAALQIEYEVDFIRDIFQILFDLPPPLHFFLSVDTPTTLFPFSRQQRDQHPLPEGWCRVQCWSGWNVWNSCYVRQRNTKRRHQCYNTGSSTKNFLSYFLLVAIFFQQFVTSTEA